MVNKILVALNSTKDSRLVFDSALSLAQSTGAEILLLNVLLETSVDYPILPTYAYYPIINDQEYQVYQQELAKYQRWGLDLLQDLTREARAAGIDTEYIQLTGTPGKIICELAKEWSAELILVGSRRLRGLKEVFLGSVSNYVTHHASCSVLIVHATMDLESSPSQASTVVESNAVKADISSEEIANQS